MDKEELKKITVEFMNKYNNIEYAKIESVMGKELLAYAELFENRIEELEKENVALKDEVHTWKEASENNSYKAFQLQEEQKTLSTHIVELQNDKGDLTDRCRELEAQIEKIKCLNEEIIKALKECPDSAWLVAHNGRARYVYLQSVIDIVNEKFEDIKEK